MKIHLSIPFVIALALLGCEEPDPKQSDPYKQLEAEHQDVRNTVAEKDSAINELFGAFNRIGENLRAIREKQGMLSSSAGNAETGGSAEERMAADLQSIDALLAENRDLIAKLRREAKSGKKQLAELQRTVDELEKAMAQKDTEIVALKEELTSANSSLATLIEMYRDKDQLATDQTVELNTAWYCVGTSKELRENGVLSKEGGVLGLRSSTKLNTASLNKDWFRKIDITETQVIPVSGKKAKLATSHPAGSYAFEGEVDNLKITDPNAFWSMSKYLVVVVD